MHIQAKRFELLRISSLAGAGEAQNNDNGENKRNTMSMADLHPMI